MNFLKKEKFKVDARQMTIKDLEIYITKWIPIIVSLQARSTKKADYAKVWDEGHNVAIIGYDSTYIFFTDPVSPYISYLPKKKFQARRHEKEGKVIYNNFGIAVYGKKPKYDSSLIKEVE